MLQGTTLCRDAFFCFFKAPAGHFEKNLYLKSSIKGENPLIINFKRIKVLCPTHKNLNRSFQR